MPIQYNEYYNEQTGLTVGIKKQLFHEQTPYQLVEVFETDTWGNLIIGGGDGGTAREVLKHPSVKKVDMVEIDEAVVRASKLHMPGVGDFDNPKLNVLYENGLTFVDGPEAEYDVIIIDGSDPVGPAVDLFKKDFYEKCHKCLKNDGVLVSQTESPLVDSYHDSIKSVFSACNELYPVTEMFLAFIPLYPTGMWSMLFASKGIEPISDEIMNRIDAIYPDFGNELKYYNKEIHIGAFALPNFVKAIIR